MIFAWPIMASGRPPVDEKRLTLLRGSYYSRRLLFGCISTDLWIVVNIETRHELHFDSDGRFAMATLFLANIVM